jgi:hypothetical protein
MTINPKRILFVSFLSALLLIPALLMARQDQESVADAARKAQAGKKPASKPAMAITNDNLDTIKGTISVVGPEPAPPADQTAPSSDKGKIVPAGDKSKAAPPDDKNTPAKDEAYWRKAFSDARKKLADDGHELDVLQREYNLKQQQYYSDPNTAMKEQFNRKDLTDTKTKIDEMTATVAQDKQAVADLEDSLRQAGGDAGWGNAQ